ncbi:MAG: alginate export family protein [Pirellulaceae bacterium]
MTPTRTALVAAVLIAWSSMNLQAQDYFAPYTENWNSYQEEEAATPLIREAEQVAGDQADSQQEPDAGADEEQDKDEDKKKEEEEKKKKCKELKQQAASAYKPLFFDNNFSYLCDPAWNESYFGDCLKKRHLPGCLGCYDIGGQYRMRAHFERNMRGLGLTGVSDDFLLHRTRLYGDFRFTPNIRFYAEFLDAESNYEDFAPRPIEVNRADMQNLFFDARLLANGDRSLTARIGRQELLYGVQRAVSPLDWANTRRTFEGVTLKWKQENLAIDGFWTNPMRIDDKKFDSPDRDQEFMGLYSSYTGRENQTIDAYFLRLLNGRGANDFEYNTLGSRWQGSRNDYLWDFEGAVQFGDNTDASDHIAGMLTLGLGRKFSNRCWKPAIWVYYDWASGDDATGAGNGFHHNFPLAHKYLGFMDLFGRRNIEDINVQLTMQPTDRLKLLLWYHYLFLETQTDTPYNVTMSAFNGGNLPGSPDLGHEIDLTAAYKIGPRQSLLLGYSHFFSGDYYNTTAGVPFDGNASFFYTQWAVNF